jgi:hypothetical protein
MATAVSSFKREGSMFLSTPESTAASWGTAAWTALLMFGGAVLKTFVDLVRNRDDGRAKWQAGMMTEQANLRAWNERQQAQLDKYQDRIDELEKKVHNERDLRHEIRNQLQAEQLKHQETKHEFATALTDLKIAKSALEDLKIEHAKLQAEHEKICLLAKPPTEKPWTEN